MLLFGLCAALGLLILFLDRKVKNEREKRNEKIIKHIAGDSDDFINKLRVIEGNPHRCCGGKCHSGDRRGDSNNPV